MRTRAVLIVGPPRCLASLRPAWPSFPWLIAAIVSVLAACGGPGLPELEPPRVAIVELELPTRRAALRVDNPVRAPMPATTADLLVEVDGRRLGRFEEALALTIPPLGSEVLTVRIDPASPAARHLGDPGPGRLRYRVTGSLALEDGSRLEVASDGWLVPTPGKPGSFR